MHICFSSQAITSISMKLGMQPHSKLNKFNFGLCDTSIKLKSYFTDSPLAGVIQIFYTSYENHTLIHIRNITLFVVSSS